jgi:hypothetical protein
MWTLAILAAAVQPQSEVQRAIGLLLAAAAAVVAAADHQQ